MTASRSGEWFLDGRAGAMRSMYEFQYHPADIRKKVRYLFVSRRTFGWIVTGAGALAALLLAGVILAPVGVRSLLLSSELRLLGHQNQVYRSILDERLNALSQLEKTVASARLQQQQMSLILGANYAFEGGGGFPQPFPWVPTVAEARDALERSAKVATEAGALLVLADELARFASEHEELTQVVPSICPLPVGSFVLTSPFGQRVSPFTGAPDFHTGIDLAAREGTPVLASGAAQVVFAGRVPLSRDVRWWRYGTMVVLRHGERYVSLYAHLESTGVKRGDDVERGDVIGTVGSSGWSTSPHLHYEVRARELADAEPAPIDPRIYILNYQWKGHEAVLVARRNEPPPTFDPLPSRLDGR